MPEITKTKTRINVPNFTIDVSQSVDSQITLSVSGTGSVTLSLSEEKRRELLEVLDVKRELAAGWDAIEECKRLHGRNMALGNTLADTKRALRLFREFTSYATQWSIGCRTHPVWTLVVKALGDDNDARVSAEEWEFLWPENKTPLGK